MSPIAILSSIAQLKPGHLLDIGARDCSIAKRFAEIGYAVDAIDPYPPADMALPDGITFRKTALEDFYSVKRYDLVLASLVSHLVAYDLRAFLMRLKYLAKADGLIYVTLLGDRDGWAGNPGAKVTTFEGACAIMADLGLRPLYRSVEWLEGRVYSGDRKFWHLYRFVLGAEGDAMPD